LRSGYWSELTTFDFARVDRERDIALLPVAAIEQHGPHLPLATDALINDGIVRRSLELMTSASSLLVLPPLSVGLSIEHASFAGTLTVGAETLLATWLDVARSVAHVGIRKLVLLNTHGGQRSLIDIAAVRMRVEHGLFAVRANYFAFGAPQGLFDEREIRYGLHGGDAETSLLMHLRPDLVRVDRLRDFGGLPQKLAEGREWLGVEKPIGFGWLSQDLSPDGVCGDASAATAAKGRDYLDFIATALVRLLDEIAATPCENLLRIR
jgi:creatinine amidohydrolase